MATDESPASQYVSLSVRKPNTDFLRGMAYSVIAMCVALAVAYHVTKKPAAPEQPMVAPLMPGMPPTPAPAPAPVAPACPCKPGDREPSRPFRVLCPYCRGDITVIPPSPTSAGKTARTEGTGSLSPPASK